MQTSHNKATLVTISEDQSGQRIDNFLLKHLKGVPKSHIYRLLRSGQVRVNRGRKKPHYKLQTDDTLRIPPVRVTENTTGKVPSAVDREDLDGIVTYVEYTECLTVIQDMMGGGETAKKPKIKVLTDSGGE